MAFSGASVPSRSGLKTPLLLRHAGFAVKTKKHQGGGVAPKTTAAARPVVATFDAAQGLACAPHALKRRAILFGGVAQASMRDLCGVGVVHLRPLRVVQCD